jgi:CDP-glycerol glycerophosphotransferase (TagB/SpsB family)
LKNYFITFYIQYPYYLPHVLPIAKKLKKYQKSILFVLSNKNTNNFIEDTLNKEEIEFTYGEDRLKEVDSKILFFLNHYEPVHTKSIIVFMAHAIGTKKCSFDSMIFIADIVFTEGDYRFNGLNQKYPQFKDKIYKIGYSKLDPIKQYNNKRISLLENMSLDPNKKTILYAPTFYPSSITKMSKSFPLDFKNCNIIVKPHYLSLNRKKYKSQVDMFHKWDKSSNIYICNQKDYDLIPFLAISDILISDESSAVFEFAALNKPVILNRFIKLRLSYMLFPQKLFKRLDQGMDIYRNIGPNPKSYKQMRLDINEELKNSSKYEKIRVEYNKKIVGIVDGDVSKRAVDILLAKSK